MSHRRRAISLVAACVIACGCAPDPASPSSASEPGSGRTEPRSAQHQSLVGRWRPTLEKRQARAVALTRFALADPPNDDAFERTEPTDEEREAYRAVVKLRTTDPTSPKLANVRQKLAEYDALFIELTPTTIMTPATATSGAKRDAYTVVSESDGSLVLDVGREHDRVAVRFVDADHIALELRSGTFRLTRDRAASP